MNLQIFSVIVDITGSIAVFAAIIFGLIQIRQFKQQRRDVAAIELVRSVQDSEFTKAFRLIHSLPEKISAADFRALGNEYADAALTVGAQYETIGLLIYKGVVPISIVEELIGAVAITLWKRMYPWVNSFRKEQSQELFLEWFQWLVEILEKRKRDQQEPAFIKHGDWQEKK